MSAETPWKVISLFDGMACGMIALVVGNLNVDRYVAFENETKYATKTASHNFPMIEQRGDVFEADFTEFEGFDLLCGGSPCTYWSIAQKNNRETEASGMGWELFCQYVRALHEAKPRFFIYENNKSMSAAIRESITKAFGFEPVCINSALVSAQNRKRLYWVGKRNEDGTYSKVDVPQPEDRGILLKDILECGHDLTSKDKSFCLTAAYDGECAWNTIERSQRSMVAEPVACRCRGRKDKNGNGYAKYECREDTKANTLDTNTVNGAMVAEPVCVAERGRYGTDGIEQHYEAREDGKTNVLTTVQKDNQVCEPVRVGCLPSPDGTIRNSQAFRLYSTEGKSVNLTAQGGGMGAKTGLYAIPVECKTIVNAIPQIVEKYGYVPEMFNAYNRAEIIEKAPTLSTGSMATSSCAVNRFEGICGYATPCEWDEDGKPTKAISVADGKNYTVYEVKDGQITIKGKAYPIKLKDGLYIIRKLTVRECMRLQTVPEWYEFPVSDSQAYKMLGNGWTVQVIVHLLHCIKAVS